MVVQPVQRSLEERKMALKELKSLHRSFLFFFSGTSLKSASWHACRILMYVVQLLQAPSSPSRESDA